MFVSRVFTNYLIKISKYNWRGPETEKILNIYIWFTYIEDWVLEGTQNFINYVTASKVSVFGVFYRQWHCLKVSVFGVLLVHIFPYLSVFSPNAGKTPNTDTFYAVYFPTLGLNMEIYAVNYRIQLECRAPIFWSSFFGIRLPFHKSWTSWTLAMKLCMSVLLHKIFQKRPK